MAYVPNSGSVVAFQSNPANLQASVTGTVTVRNGASVSGTLGASILGTVPVTQVTSPWIITGSVQASISPAANQSVSGTVQVDVRSSVAVVIIGGSIAASFTPPANQSVSGAVSVSNFPTTQNVSGSVVATQGTVPWVVNSTGSVITVGQGSIAVAIISGSIAASFTPPANQSVSGTVTVNQGTTPWVQTGSVQGTVSVLGTVPVTQATTPWIIGSVYGNFSGSVAATITNTNVNVSGSVAAFQAGTHIASISGNVTINSIVGTYAEDSAHADGNAGIFVLGVRNDSISSFVSANTDYTPIALDSAGRVLTKPFSPDQSIVTGNGSVINAGFTVGSVLLMAAPGAGLRNYLTDFNIANTGATTALVYFADIDTSILGRTIAPAGGGSNHSFVAPLTTLVANKAIYLVTSVASSIIYGTVTGYKAP